LSEAHAADEQSNACSALPNRPANVRMGMEGQGALFGQKTSLLNKVKEVEYFIRA
jgi:hypothetical protein